jgi:fused signal recognition particle receptor
MYKKASWKEKLKNALTPTKELFIQSISKLINGRSKIDEEMLEEIERILIEADIGVEITFKLIDVLKQEKTKPDQIQDLLKDKIVEILSVGSSSLNIDKKPFIIPVVGVNGVGKTTTIAKLGKRFKDEDLKVMFVAADTFRAAAIDQLEHWAEKLKVDFIKHQHGSDPAAVIYDSIIAAQSRDIDVVIIDTAGRLHTKINLMEELRKINRVCSKLINDAPHEVLLTLDATTGQNALVQARQFTDYIPITGIVLAKLDGTSKGGIVVAIADQLKIPIKLIGTGEDLSDLIDFDPEEFAQSLVEGL